LLEDNILRYSKLIENLEKHNKNHVQYLRSYLLPYGEKNGLQFFTRPRYYPKTTNPKPIEGTFSTCFALFSLLRSHDDIKSVEQGLHANNIFQEYAEDLSSNSSSWHYPPFPSPFDIYTTPFKLICLHMISEQYVNSKLKFTMNIIIALHDIVKNLDTNTAAKFSSTHDYSGFLSYWNFVALFLFYEKLPPLKQLIKDLNMKSNSKIIKINTIKYQPKTSRTKLESQNKKIEKKYLPTRHKIEKLLKNLFIWSRDELYKQATFYHIEEGDRIDPIRTIFCLSIYKLYNEIRKEGKIPLSDLDIKYNKKGVNVLLGEIFSRGGDSLWKKYLPILAIPSYDGNVYPFPLSSLNRMLSLVELTDSFLDSYLGSIEEALEWIRHNERTNVPYTGENYTINEYFEGWRSSHSSNPNGHPECWSTALVFDTTQNMEKRCRKFRSNAILSALNGTINDLSDPEEFIDRWDSTLNLQKDTKKSYSLKKILFEEIIFPRIQKNEEQWSSISNSGVLYGPPGTGKSTLVESIAKTLGWSYLRVDTALLLQSGLDKASNSVSKIFNLLTKLEKTVILFDEIDECIRDRQDSKDTVLENRLLTNTMLTKLNDLAKNEKIIFFIATNYGDKIDVAIRRPGRFDLLLDVNYPHYDELLKFMNKEFQKFKYMLPITIQEELILEYKKGRKTDTLEELTFTRWEKFVEDSIVLYSSSNKSNGIVEKFKEYFIVKETKNNDNTLKSYFPISTEKKLIYRKNFVWRDIKKLVIKKRKIIF